MMKFLLSELGLSILNSVSVIVILGILFVIIALIYDLVNNWERYYDIRKNNAYKKIFFIFIAFFIFILSLIFPFSMHKMRSEKTIVKSAKEDSSIKISDKFDFIEREFYRQVKHQLNDANIILFLNDTYSGEYEDRFIELKGSEYNLDLKNIVFYNGKVIYEFIHKSNNN